MSEANEQKETVEQAYERGQKDMLRLLSKALELAGKWREAKQALEIVPVAYSAPNVAISEDE